MDRIDGGRTFGPDTLVAISACGDWWVYPWAMRLTRVHDLLRFHASAPCKICVSGSDANVDTHALPPVSRVN